jgi:hypothetical protein
VRLGYADEAELGKPAGDLAPGAELILLPVLFLHCAASRWLCCATALILCWSAPRVFADDAVTNRPFLS